LAAFHLRKSGRFVGENTRIDPDGVKVRALDDATALNGVRGDDDLTSR
jgi:hypothetical protein